MIRERGQILVLFGVLLAVIVVVGSVLALNLTFLVGQFKAIQEAAASAAAAGALETSHIPGQAGLRDPQAGIAARQLLRRNLEAIPFLDRPAAEIAAQADIRVVNPAPGVCEPDPFEPAACYAAPFVSLQVEAPVQTAWGGWVIPLRVHAAAQAGQRP